MDIVYKIHQKSEIGCIVVGDWSGLVVVEAASHGISSVEGSVVSAQIKTSAHPVYFPVI